ncbi:MAG: selenide, water dikinase SelD [Erysipelotrichaceae bacterium]|nr:selenide, water dikinase SelD [Erysipelotrichaceae bacterium]
MMEDILFCANGGCTAKLGANVLDKVLSKLEKNPDENLLVGFDSHDDGAVYKINDTQAIVTTLDFFPPMIEDPYLFGQIAAANALSDIYAMGGEVLTAMNIVCFPEQTDLNVLGKIMQGGNDKVNEAGGVLVGGHSIHDESVKYGMSVTGVVHPDRIYRNDTPQSGDALILTKPLGVGIIMTAHRVKQASEQAVIKAVQSMTTLNKYTADILKNYTVHACSDVTGFGFLVHLGEMLQDKYSATVQSKRIPYFKECEQYVNEFYITGAAQKNRNHMEGKVLFECNNFVMEEILFDPQTSGGLLVAIPQADVMELVYELNKNNIPAQVVGTVEEKKGYTIRVI